MFLTFTNRLGGILLGILLDWSEFVHNSGNFGKMVSVSCIFEQVVLSVRVNRTSLKIFRSFRPYLSIVSSMAARLQSRIKPICKNDGILAGIYKIIPFWSFFTVFLTIHRAIWKNGGILVGVRSKSSEHRLKVSEAAALTNFCSFHHCLRHLYWKTWG